MHFPTLRIAFAAGISLVFPFCISSAFAEEPDVQVVEVVGVTSVPGAQVSVKNIPANVQIYGSNDIGRQHLGNLADFLERNPGSVNINNAQGNPFQADIGFRGFTASPLLGVPQGLSVFQDGARINEPFGDVVNWDLLPQSAIAKIALIPGSNPVFGLNTLGGAVAVETKRGADYPGGDAELSAGSFGRTSLEVEQGGKSGNWDYFLTGNAANDRGWADHNPSRVRQFFGQGGYRDSLTDIALALTAVDNTLEGTQTIPDSFAGNPRQAYTYPDRNRNRLEFLTSKGSRIIADGVTVGANAYWRHYRNQSVASNVNDDFGGIDPDTGDTDDVQATNDRSAIDQTSYGLGMQLTLFGKPAGKINQLVVGANADIGNARFTQETQEANFTADRGTTGIGDYSLETDAETGNRYQGVFLFDTLMLNEEWTATLSGRYNQARVTIADQTGMAPELDGDHRFSRFNPAIGMNFNPTKQLTAYASYNEGMRAPTPIELTCSDPDAPCKLPNDFLADPPLKKIVSRTAEFGARGNRGKTWQWSAAVYRTNLQDDIQFINSGGASTNAGYFQNVGETRRQGIELSSSAKLGSIGIGARYSYIAATYQSGFVAPGQNNTSAGPDGTIAIRPGDRIPGIPRHTLKARIDYDVNAQWRIGVGGVFNSGIFARGDENNLDARGRIPGYAVFNMDSAYALSKGLDLFVRVNNLFDRRYANFGILGSNAFTGPDHAFNGDQPASEQFRGYGAPRGLWFGIRRSW